MLEHCYVNSSTIDRIRDSWLGSQIENYVEWMEANSYSSRAVFRRLPQLFCFAEFAQKRDCTDVASAVALVEEFVSEWLVQYGAESWVKAQAATLPSAPLRMCALGRCELLFRLRGRFRDLLSAGSPRESRRRCAG
jgi:hypothetical protein